MLSCWLMVADSWSELSEGMCIDYVSFKFIKFKYLEGWKCA